MNLFDFTSDSRLLNPWASQDYLTHEHLVCKIIPKWVNLFATYSTGNFFLKDPSPGFIYLFKFGHDFDLSRNNLFLDNKHENDRRADFCFLSKLDSGKMINGKLGGQVSQKE